MISSQKISEIFSKFNAEGFINISNVKSIELNYDSFMDEITIESEDITSATISIIKDNRKAVVSIDSCSILDIEKAIQEGISVISFSEQDSDISMPEASGNDSGDFYSEEISNIGVDFLKSEFNKIKKYNFQKGLRMEDYGSGYRETEHFFISSNGAYKSCKNNYYSFFISLVGEKGDLKDSVRKSETTKKLKNFSDGDILKLENELLDKLSPEKSGLKEGEYTVTLDRDVVSSFLGFILGSLGAETIREKMGLFAGKNIGDKILSNDITIINDPHLEGGLGNIVFDSEGITCKKYILIENGVLKSKFCDSKNSKKEGGQFLGNSSSFNIIFESSKYSDDFLKDSQFLFTNLMAFHSVDSNTGNFSLNGEGYLIENGKKTKYVKNISLSGNVKDIFNNIVAIGNDIKESSTKKIGSVTFKKGYVTP